jgi:hypothetical protein
MQERHLLPPRLRQTCLPVQMRLSLQAHHLLLPPARRILFLLVELPHL